MKKKDLVRCPANDMVLIRKSTRCPSRECRSCPDNKAANKRTKRADADLTSYDFANEYLAGRTFLNTIYFTAIKRVHASQNLTEESIYEIKEVNILSSLNNSKITTDIKEKISEALHDFVFPIKVQAVRPLKTLNQDQKKNIDTIIKLLERVLSFTEISWQLKNRIVEELTKLKGYGEEKIKYNSQKEMEFIATWFYRDRLNNLYGKRMRELSSGKDKRAESAVPFIPKGDIALEKLSQEMAETQEQYTRMLHARLIAKGGRPSDYYLKALISVVYRLLTKDAKMPKEKSKKMVVDVVNEYYKKQACQVKLTYKVVDSTVLHSSK